MPTVASANSIAELQTATTFPGAVVFLTAPGRQGAFIWRSGNFAAQVASDPQKGIYVPSSASMPTIGCWVRDWDGAHGRPEWFGAVVDDPTADNVPAITACFALCRVTQLGPYDYYIRSTLGFDRSNHSFIGVPCAPINRDVGVGPPARMGNAGGSRVILAGPKTATDTVFQFGKRVPPASDGEALTRNAVLRDINFCRDNADYRARNSSTGNAVDCVKGIVCSGLSSALIGNVSSFDSPVGWHCFGCVYSKWDDCSAWRSTPAADANNDFSVGFLIGGYARNYGYAGANASVYFNRCVAYDLRGGSVSVGLRLFGAIADTFLTQIEVGRCYVGIEIDGRDAQGTTMPVSEAVAEHNVHLINPIIDATTQQGLQLRNLNRAFQVSVVSPYIATAGAIADLSILGGANKVEGHVSITGGSLLSEGGKGLIATDAVGISVVGTLFRNYSVPISLTNCRSCRIEPDVYNYTAMAADGIYLKDLRRSSVKPIIRGIAGKPGFVSGIRLDGGENNAVDPTMVDYAAFTEASPAHKVVYGGRDARSDPSFKAAGNVLLGMID